VYCKQVEEVIYNKKNQYINMTLLRYLGGIGLGVLGFILLIIGIVAIIKSGADGLFFLIPGIILIAVGNYYVKTALRYTPIRIEFEKELKPKEEFKQKEYKEIQKVIVCLRCGYENPYDAFYCLKCGKKLRKTKKS